MKHFLSLTLLLLSMFKVKAQNEDLSKNIVGDWVFQYAEAKDLHVDNSNVKDSIIADIAKNKYLLKAQVLSYTKESVLRVTLNDTISEGTYRIESNVETYTFDDYTSEDIITIVGDTLRIEYDQTEYYQQQANEVYLMDNDAVVSKVITSYIYLRKE